MTQLFLAEWRKISGNYLLIGFLIWIIPIGIATLSILTLAAAFVSQDAGRLMAQTSSGYWTVEMVGVFSLLLAFPANVFGRMLPVAFMAVLYAGEYQWGTFRLVLPRTDREKLILTKSAAVVVLVLLAYVATSAIAGIGTTLVHAAIGEAYGPALTSAVLAEFGTVYLGHLLLATLALMILAGFAAFASILTRSILGGLLGGLGLLVLEPMSLILLYLLGQLFKAPQLINLYRWSATYNLDNARSLIATGQPVAAPFQGFVADHSLLFSLGILIAWIVAFLTAATVLFRRQDITA